MELFEGLGLKGWLKLVFQTRAQTIKQCDLVTAMLTERLRSSTQVQERLAKTLIKQHNALEEARAALERHTTAENRRAWLAVNEALDSAWELL